MSIVTRLGAHTLVDADAVRGAGEASLYNPLRNGLDFNAALGQISDTVRQAGQQIGGAIEGTVDGIVDFIYQTTGIDLSDEVELLEHLLSLPIAALDGSPLGPAVRVLGMFLPFLPSADPDTFDPQAAAIEFINGVLNPTGLLASVTALAEALTGNPGDLVSIENWSNLVPQLVGGLIPPALIPLLDATKLGTGTIDLARLPASVLTTASQIAAAALTGTVDLARLPASVLTTASSLAAAMVTGTLSAGVIPLLDATKVGTGTLDLARLPASVLTTASQLAASALTGTVDLARLPASVLTNVSAIAAANLTGLIDAARIPLIDASKIGSGTLAQARAAWAAPIDTLMQSWGGVGTGFSVADLAAKAQNIGSANIVGVLGAPNIGAALQNLLDGAVQGVIGGAIIGNGIAQVQQHLSAAMAFLGFTPAGTNTPPTSVAAITSNNNAAINARAVQKPIFDNLDPTADATFPLSTTWGAPATLPTIPVTQLKSAIGYITIRDGAPQKQAVTWQGYGLTNVDAFYVNLYTVNKVNGQLTPLWTTGDIKGSVGTGVVPVWNSANMAALAYVNTTQGDKFAVEYCIKGTGTYNIVGTTICPQQLPHPSAIPALPAAARILDTPPTFQTSGAYANATGGTFCQASTTINVTAGDRIIVATESIGYRLNSVIAYYNGVAMNGPVAILQYNVGSVLAYTHIWEATATATGTATIQGNAGAAAGGNTNISVLPASYRNCSSVAALATNAGGGGTSVAQTVAAAPSSSLVVQTFGASGAAGMVFSAYSGMTTTRANSGSPNGTPLVVGEKVGTGSNINVTGTLSTAPVYGWGGVAVELKGIVNPVPTTMANPTPSGGTLNWSNLVPWCGLSGVQGQTQYSPVIVAIPASGTFDPTLYPWANYFDRIVCGAGGGGSGGNAGGTGGGVGGAGSWGQDTLTKAQAGTSLWTATIGAGGAGGPAYSTAGGAGGGTTLNTPGFGSVGGAGGGGAGGGASSGSAYGASPAPGPGNLTYYDAHGQAVTITGGAGGGYSSNGGFQPGGAGAGGNSTFAGGGGTTGGSGGAGEAFVRVYQ